MEPSVILVSMLIRAYQHEGYPIPLKLKGSPCIAQFVKGTSTKKNSTSPGIVMRVKDTYRKIRGGEISQNKKHLIILESYLGEFHKGKIEHLNNLSNAITNDLAGYIYGFKDIPNKEQYFSYLMEDTPSHPSEEECLALLKQLFPDIISVSPLRFPSSSTPKPLTDIPLQQDGVFSTRFDTISPRYCATWKLYIRKSEDDDGDIECYPVKISRTQRGKFNEIRFINNIEDGQADFEGVIGLGNNCLVAFMQPTEAESKRHLHLIMRIHPENTQELMVGQITYNLQKNSRIVTHTAIMVKSNETSTELRASKIPRRSPSYYTLPKEIRFYLDQRGLNLLRSPGDMIIYNTTNLGKWLKVNNPLYEFLDEAEFKLNDLVGTYEVYNIQNENIAKLRAEVRADFSVKCESQAARYKGSLAKVFGMGEKRKEWIDFMTEAGNNHVAFLHTDKGVIIRMVEEEKKEIHFDSTLKVVKVDNQLLLLGVFSGTDPKSKPMFSSDIWIKTEPFVPYNEMEFEEIPLIDRQKIQMIWEKYPYLRTFLSGEQPIVKKKFDYFFHLTEKYFEMSLSHFFYLHVVKHKHEDIRSLIDKTGFPYWEASYRKQITEVEMLAQKYTYIDSEAYFLDKLYAACHHASQKRKEDCLACLGGICRGNVVPKFLHLRSELKKECVPSGSLAAYKEEILAEFSVLEEYFRE